MGKYQKIPEFLAVQFLLTFYLFCKPIDINKIAVADSLQVKGLLEISMIFSSGISVAQSIPGFYLRR